MEDEAEAFVVLKTARSRVAELMRTIRGLHPYDVPEVLVLGVEAGDEAYTEWVLRETVPVGDGDGPAAGGRTGEP